MFARFVQVRIDPAKAGELSTLFAERVIPALFDTPGCLYCGLAQDAESPREAVSMTFWASREHAEAYERSGLFSKLLDESRPYLKDSMEWSVRLSEDLRLQPASSEPDVEGYSEIQAPDGTLVGPGALDFRHLRIGTFSVEQGQEEQFARVFHTEVMPLLRTVPGCRHVQLARHVGSLHRFAIITVWVSAEAATACDEQHLFERIVGFLRPTLSDLSQWKMDLHPAEAARTATSQDVGVRSYVLLTGRAKGLA